MTDIKLNADAENPLNPYRLFIAEHLLRILEDGYAEKLSTKFKAEDIAAWVEYGKNNNEDFSFPVPRLRLKGVNAIEVAKDIADKFPADEVLESCTSAGAFLSWKTAKLPFVKSLFSMLNEKRESFGTSSARTGKTIIMEFSSPNIAKPFHAGHLRSTVIGNFMGNVLRAHGADVICINYLGDWGKQYGLLAIGFEKFGDEKLLEEDAIKHLYDVYVKINKTAEADPTVHDQARAYFKRMEDGDREALALWEKFRDLSIVKYKATYKRLNIAFDVYSGESQVTEPMERALNVLKEKEILSDSNGASVINLEKYKCGVCVVQKKDGTSLYITRDIGAAWERHDKYQFDEMYYVVAAQQDLHFKQLFKTLELMDIGDWHKNCHHINFGMVLGMSTRRGTVVFLQDLLEGCQQRMHEVMKSNEAKYAQVKDPELTSDILGISAIIVQDMTAKRHKDYEFDWDRCFQFEGDTGPFLQYSHARMTSILANYTASLPVDSEFAVPAKSLDKLQFERFTQSPQALALLQEVSRYPDLVLLLTRQFEPCNLLTFLFSLCHKVSSAYEVLWVRNREQDEAFANAMLYWAARGVLNHGIKLLGLTPLERM